MSRPEFVIGNLQRTEGRLLPTSVVRQIRARLLQSGFVLLPSDTCYSLGALAIDKNSRHNVNAILDRKLGPISLAFGNYLQVRQLVEVNSAIDLLLERFTPGPITIVCKAKESVPDDFLLHTIGSTDRTIGVRIPDSSVERDIAASTEHPLMTVAVRDFETGEAIQDFERAQEIVSIGIEQRLKGANWAAIEADNDFHPFHSTVIRISGAEKVDLLRKGDEGSAEEILDFIKKHLGWEIEDLT
ncbi:MAG: L-threonylcarbamoyladenylate synthase [Acidobacteriota bacterium]|jgi:L-threonylcarbamoyladenylate synthase|nr:L-threonylcarbamoyladenylate synthase [Acidobacteriota bacterium]